MRHMVVGCMVVIGYIEMTRLEMTYYWTLQIRGWIDTSIILVLIQIGTMIMIIIILIGVIGGIFFDEFKKENPPTFDGEMKKPQDAKEWFLGMRKLSRLPDYSENMKSRVSTFNIKGKSTHLVGRCG